MRRALRPLALAAVLWGAAADRRTGRAGLHGQAALRGPGPQPRHAAAAGGAAALLSVAGGADGGAGAEEGAASAEAVVAEAERAAANEEATAADTGKVADAQAEGSEDGATAEQEEEEAAAKRKRAKALQVKIVKARGLRFSDGKQLGVTDPYCVCEIPGKPNAKVQTLAIDGLHGVHWNHAGAIEDYKPGDSLRCSVYERDALPRESFLGRVTLTSRQLATGFKGELALKDAGEGVHAFLRLSVGRRGALGALAEAESSTSRDSQAESSKGGDGDSEEDEESEDEDDDDDDDDGDSSEGERKSPKIGHVVSAKKKSAAKN